jgi:hypothetical protein
MFTATVWWGNVHSDSLVYPVWRPHLRRDVVLVGAAEDVHVGPPPGDLPFVCKEIKKGLKRNRDKNPVEIDPIYENGWVLYERKANWMLSRYYVNAPSPVSAG